MSRNKTEFAYWLLTPDYLVLYADHMPIRAPVFRQGSATAPASPPPDLRYATFDARRGSSTARGYDRAWQRCRAVVLDKEPLCRPCLAAGRATAATEVHHEQPIVDAPHLRLDPDNLVPVCHPCHMQIEAKHRQRR